MTRQICVQDEPVADFSLTNLEECADFDFYPNNLTEVEPADVDTQNIPGMDPHVFMNILSGTNSYSFEPHFNFFEPGDTPLHFMPGTTVVAIGRSR